MWTVLPKIIGDVPENLMFDDCNKLIDIKVVDPISGDMRHFVIG